MYKSPPQPSPSPWAIPFIVQVYTVHYRLETPFSFFQALLGDLPSSAESDMLCLCLCDLVVCMDLGMILFTRIACDMLLAHFSWCLV